MQPPDSRSERHPGTSAVVRLRSGHGISKRDSVRQTRQAEMRRTASAVQLPAQRRCFMVPMREGETEKQEVTCRHFLPANAPAMDAGPGYQEASNAAPEMAGSAFSEAPSEALQCRR